MNKIIYFFGVLFLFFSTQAQTNLQPISDDQYQWLYEDLFSAQSRQEMPDETFKSFRVHLKDSNQSFPQLSDLVARNLTKVNQVKGTITYVSVVKKKYLFDVIQTPEAIVLNVRVYLRNPTAQDTIDFKQKVQQAEDNWNQNRVATDFNYKFKFEIVNDSAQAHFSVFVLDSTRGPYDLNWGRNWSSSTITHEIGHMLGLGDEYQTISSKVDCYRLSIMCEDRTGALMPHHYYFVIRRLFQSGGIYLE